MLALGTVCQAPASITQTPKWLQTAHASSSPRRVVVSWRPRRRLRVGSRFRSPHTREAGRDARTRPPRAHALRRHRVAHLNSLPSPTALVMLCFLSETKSHVLSSTDLPWPSGRGNDFPASPLGPPDAWSSHRSGRRGPIRSESGRLPPQGGRRPSCVGPQA